MEGYFDRLVSVTKSRVPGFEVRYKDKSKLQKLIGWILHPFNDSYMTDYITTFYPYVYWPDKESVEENKYHAFETLSHEFVHLMDTKKHPVWFRFSYMFPQILGLILPFVSLFAIWFSNWWLLWIASIIFCVLPLPAYWRMKWEMRGFAMTMAVDIWARGKVSEASKEWIVEQFISGFYFWMWPFRKNVEKRLNEIEKKIHNGEILGWCVAFEDVFALFKEK